MINIRNIITALLISSTIFLISCGTAGDGTESTTGDFGYISRYQGYTHHAVYTGYANAEIVAKALVNAINTGNKIYAKTISAIIPQLYLDNGTTYMQENGTCIQNYGRREYNTTMIPETNIPVYQESYINYNNYCLLDSLSSGSRQVIINKRSYLEETAYFDGLQYNVYHYELLSEEGMEVKIQETASEWDNMTINGLFLKDTKCIQKYNKDCVSDNMTISMDMPGSESSYRFDLYAEEVRRNGSIPEKYTRSIKFYHKDFGYVTADIVFLRNNISITDGDIITMKFQDKDCEFSIDEFGTTNFNCGDYPDYPVN